MPKKHKILFVDDEPNILDGLRRMMRSLRKEFEMDFAESGRTALKLMEEEEFDVIVSDMRMPGMDGAELLTKTQKRFPHLVRIMLTGQADEESIMRTVGVAHQFLAKPCDPEILKGTILRTIVLHQLMADGNLKSTISGISALPSLPAIYVKLQNVLRDTQASVDDVAAIIEEDIAMTAKVLQLVNSAFFGLYQRVDTPARAVSLLGMDTIKALTLGVKIFSEIQVTSTQYPIDSLWSHSMKVGGCAKKIAAEVTEKKDIIDNSFTAGILHDIGKLILISNMPEKYDGIIALAREENIPIRSAELQIMMTNHNVVGAYLLGLWGLPSSVVEALAFFPNLDSYPQVSFSPALAVHIANTFCENHKQDGVADLKTGLNNDCIESLGLTKYIEKWQEICRDLLEQTNDDN